eukprot:SAG31_NODE_6936_length_1843_cov_17.330849_1_plen_218_part_00
MRHSISYHLEDSGDRTSLNLSMALSEGVSQVIKSIRDYPALRTQPARACKGKGVQRYYDRSSIARHLLGSLGASSLKEMGMASFGLDDSQEDGYARGTDLQPALDLFGRLHDWFGDGIRPFVADDQDDPAPWAAVSRGSKPKLSRCAVCYRRRYTPPGKKRATLPKVCVLCGFPVHPACHDSNCTPGACGHCESLTRPEQIWNGWWLQGNHSPGLDV